MATKPWSTLGIDLLVDITQLTEACKSWLLSTPEINERSGKLLVAERAWRDLAALKGQSERARNWITKVELRRAWEAFFAAGKERCQDSSQSRCAEAQLDAQSVLGMNQNSLLTESECSELRSLLQKASSQRFTQWVDTDLYPENMRLAHDKWLDAVYLIAEDRRVPEPDFLDQIRRTLAGRERYHGDAAAATAPLLSRTNADKGAGRSIAWRSVDRLGSEVEELVAPANIQSQAMVNGDRRIGRKKTSLTDDEWRVLDARMAYPEMPFWGAEMPKVVGLSAERIESINKSLESDRPAGREIRKLYDIYLPPAKRQY